MNKTAETVAAMTEAQKCAMLAAPDYWDSFVNPDIESLQHLYGIGLLDYREFYVFEEYRINPQGQAVRALLLENSK